jgi:hypothetical protein
MASRVAKTPSSATKAVDKKSPKQQLKFTAAAGMSQRQSSSDSGVIKAAYNSPPAVAAAVAEPCQERRDEAGHSKMHSKANSGGHGSSTMHDLTLSHADGVVAGTMRKPSAVRQLRVIPPPALSFPDAAAEGCEDAEDAVSDIDSSTRRDSPRKAAAAVAVDHAGSLHKARGVPKAAGSPASRATPASLSLRPGRAVIHQHERPTEAAVSNSPTWRAAKAQAWAAYQVSNTMDAASLSLRGTGTRSSSGAIPASVGRVNNLGSNPGSGKDTRQWQWPESCCSNSPSGSSRGSPSRLRAQEPEISPTRLHHQKISLRKTATSFGGY